MNKQQTHLLDRTSPIGDAFEGTCRLCGQPGLPMSAVMDYCENPRKRSADQAVLDAILMPGDKQEGEDDPH